MATKGVIDTLSHNVAKIQLLIIVNYWCTCVHTTVVLECIWLAMKEVSNLTETWPKRSGAASKFGARRQGWYLHLW